MISDAHVHMGYYPRKGYDGLCYFSPQRIYGILKRCDIDEFIVSSTCSQVDGIKITDIEREAMEMRKIAGERVHVFFWLSRRLYDEDPSLDWLDHGLFDGIKLHEGETPWVGERFSDLCNILECVGGRDIPVQIHAGMTGAMQPRRLRELAERFEKIRFDFAHCRPMDEMAEVMAECPNVWTDTAFMALDEFERLNRYDWHGRLMFGTDLPVWQAYEPCGLTERYREYVAAFRRTGIDSERAFRSFIGR